MIYLDNGATTFPKPKPVYEAMEQAAIRFGANPGRGGHALSLQAGEELFRARQCAAEFFGCDGAEKVVFTCNATMALNMAIYGLLRPGDHVITSNFEHNAVARPCYALSRKGVQWSVATVFPGDDDRTVAAFERCIRPNTRLIICNHVSNVFGNVMPVERIGALAKRRGILFLVDASQSAGVLPIHMVKQHIDILAAAGHKSLYGPAGTGLLLNQSGAEMEPLLQGGTGSESMKLSQPDYWPDRMESGTVNMPAMAGLRAGMEQIASIGLERIAAYELSLREWLRCELEKLEKAEVFQLGNHNTGVLSFRLKEMDSEEVAARLDEKGIAVRAGLHCAPLAHRAAGTIRTGTVRVSPGIFNTLQEMEQLVECVKVL